MGQESERIARTSINIKQLPIILSIGLPSQLLAKRPDVQQAELNFRMAFELKNVAQASLYPSLTSSPGTIGYAGNTLSNFFKPENIFANFIGGITQPLFARKQLTGNLKIAKAEQEITLLTFQQTVLTAGKEVSGIIYSFKNSESKNSTRTKQIESLSTAVYFTQELLITGDANYTEVINAEQSLLNAQLGRVSDKLEQLQLSVFLYRALGEGVE